MDGFKVLATLIIVGAGVEGAQAQNKFDSVQTDSHDNTAMGFNVLVDEDGFNNTGAGGAALFENTTGNNNSAFGSDALYLNSTGSNDTALGVEALSQSSTANDNTAVGYQALYLNKTGSFNVASGSEALGSNTTGSDNTASGYNALSTNTSGANNTATGYDALHSNTTADYNTADGYGALYSNTTGVQNTASGFDALYSNRAGGQNSALGQKALYYSTGVNNTALGFHAGINLTGGSNNIEIGNLGVAAESGVIRIGTPATHTTTFIAGIASAKLTGAAVYVNSSGQLGVLASSERYKTAIAPMGGDTEKLQQLRPVSFHLKNDPDGVRQYGLIAEEVDRVYPELVIHDARGQIQGVRYDELAPMLLNEVQNLKRQNAVLMREVAQQRDLRSQVIAMQAAIANLEAKGARLASR
jgi:hypothetical protein